MQGSLRYLPRAAHRAAHGHDSSVLSDHPVEAPGDRTYLAHNKQGNSGDDDTPGAKGSVLVSAPYCVKIDITKGPSVGYDKIYP